MTDLRRRVINTRTGMMLGDSIEVATTLRSRLIGLLGHRSLDAGAGLWIEPCSSIHMFFMRFSIDAVFLDDRDRVVRTFAMLRPWRVAVGGRRARAVLELPAGTIVASGTRVGDLLRMTPR